MRQDPCLLSAHELSREIASGRVSSSDATEAHLARIARADARLHAYIDVYGDEARAAAAQADKDIRAGRSRGPFHGVPIAVKDIIDIEGHVTTGGSASRLDHVAKATATIVRKALDQGMVVLGKTHTVEFACGAWGTNQHMGTPWNPWDRKVARVPGGSSSGSGVAVAARMAPWALGTDTGCSVRQPAAWCGITGLKATIGRLSTYGILPLSPTLDTPGTLARTVRDAAALYNLLQGPDPLDALTQRHPTDDPMPSIDAGVRGLKLARLPAAERDHVQAEVMDAYDQSLEVFAKLGATIVDIALPFRLGDFTDMTSITNAEGYLANKATIDDPAAKVDEVVRRRLLGGAKIPAHEYLAAMRLREEVKRKWSRAMDGIDAFLTPSTQTAAFPLAEIDYDAAPVRFARWVNLLDLCAVVVPNGFTRDAMPTSLQVVGRGYEEAMVVRVGHAFQASTDWHRRAPPEE